MHESDTAKRLSKLAMAMTLFRCPQLKPLGVNYAVKLLHPPIQEVNESDENHRAAKSGLRKQKIGQ
jgi:hypothetical protein